MRSYILFVLIFINVTESLGEWCGDYGINCGIFHHNCGAGCQDDRYAGCQKDCCEYQASYCNTDEGCMTDRSCEVDRCFKLQSDGKFDLKCNNQDCGDGCAQFKGCEERCCVYNAPNCGGGNDKQTCMDKFKCGVDETDHLKVKPKIQNLDGVQCASDNSNGAKNCPECTKSTTCKCNGIVAYGYGKGMDEAGGKNSKWKTLQVRGSIECTHTAFGIDEDPNQGKICVCTGATQWNCKTGQVKADAKIVAEHHVNSVIMCGRACDLHSACFAFDVTTIDKEDSCRLVVQEAPGGALMEMGGTGGPDKRQFCKPKPICCPENSGGAILRCTCTDGKESCKCGLGQHPCSFETKACYYWGECDPTCNLHMPTLHAYSDSELAGSEPQQRTFSDFTITMTCAGIAIAALWLATNVSWFKSQNSEIYCSLLEDNGMHACI